MKQFFKVLKFELKNYFENKVFVGVTIFIMLAVAVLMFFPRISGAFSSSDNDGKFPQNKDKPTMFLAGDFADLAMPSFTSAFSNYDVQITNEEIDVIKSKIVAGEVSCAFVIDSITSYSYYVNNISMYDNNQAIANEVLQSVYRMNALMLGGMSAEDAGAVLSTQINAEIISLGKNQMQNFFYTYIMIFALYMVILLYGQMVATGVATEKTSRAMELLITSAKPTSMMFGKIIAACLAGLTQLIAVFGSALLFYQLNSDMWGDNPIIKSIFNMPIDLFVYMLIFFVLGFLIYAFLYGAVGSTANKLEDINTSVMPITMLFVVGFLIVMFSMTNGEVDSLLMKVSSFIPFTSPMAMFTRIAMSSVPIWEILISVVMLIASVFGVGVFSAKIYRRGVLMYGKQPKISVIIKSVFKKQ